MTPSGALKHCKNTVFLQDRAFWRLTSHIFVADFDKMSFRNPFGSTSEKFWIDLGLGIGDREGLWEAKTL